MKFRERYLTQPHPRGRNPLFIGSGFQTKAAGKSASGRLLVKLSGRNPLFIGSGFQTLVFFGQHVAPHALANFDSVVIPFSSGQVFRRSDVGEMVPLPTPQRAQRS